MAAPGDIVGGLRLERPLGRGAWRARAVDTGRVVRLQPGRVPAALLGKELPGLVPARAHVEGPAGPATVLDFLGARLVEPGARLAPSVQARLEQRRGEALRSLAQLGVSIGEDGQLQVVLAPPELDASGEPVGPPVPWLLPPAAPTLAAEDERPVAPVLPAATVSRPSLSPTGAGRSAQVKALVVDETGQGHVVALQLVLEPGEGRAWAPEGVARDAQVAAQLAMAAALGGAARRWDLRWTVADHRVVLHGSSIGLAVGVGVGLLARGVALPAGWAFTGGVELDGQITRVAGVPAKLRAAAQAGIEVVGVAAPELPGLVGPPGLELRGLARLDELLLALQPPLPRRRWWGLALLVVPLLLALTGLLSPAEAWVGHGLLGLVRGPLPAEDVAVLAVDLPDPRALRPRHPATLRALAAVGARAVVFDLALSADSPHDAEIASAVGELSAAGVPVLLPLRFRLDGVSGPPEALVEAGALTGIVEAHKDLLLDVVQATPMRRLGPDGTVHWHLAALAAAAAQRPERPPTPRLDGDTLVIGALRNPTWAGLLSWPPTALPPAVPYGAVEDYSVFRDKVVFIGAWGGSEDVHLTPSGRRYGVEILAGSVQTLLRQEGLRRAPPEGSALLALLAGLGTAWLASALPVGRRRRALVVPVAIGAVGAALALAGVLVAVLPAALAALVGLWAERRARAGAGLAPLADPGAPSTQ